MLLAPAKDAPIAMFIADISSSVCFVTILNFCSFSAKKCRIEDAGVMGYVAKKFKPAAIAANDIISLPVRTILSLSSDTLLRFNSFSEALYPSIAAR